MTDVRRSRRSLAWRAALGGVVLLSGAVLYFLTFILVDDRRVSLPDRTGRMPQGMDLSASPVGGRFPTEAEATDWGAASSIARLVWEEGGRCRVTLPDAVGITRRRSWGLTSGGEIIVSVTVPPAGRLIFHEGLLSRGAGARLAVELESAEGRVPLGAWDRAPGRKGWGGRRFRRSEGPVTPWAPWLRREIDLGDWSGHAVRIHFRSIVVSDRLSPTLLLVGNPSLVSPASSPRGGAGRTESALFLTVATRSAPDLFRIDEPVDSSRLADLRRSGAVLARLYTPSTRAATALRECLTVSSVGAADGSSLAGLFRRDGHRTAAVGVWPEGQVPFEDDFDVVFQLPADGYEPRTALQQASTWLSSGGGNFFLFVHLPDLPARRWPPVRFWSWRARVGEGPLWRRWRRASEARYQDDGLSALAEAVSMEEHGPVVAFASLRGVGGGLFPVRRGRQGRMSFRPLRPGRALREAEIRVSAFLKGPGVTPGRTVTEAMPLRFLAGALWRVSHRSPLEAGRDRSGGDRVFIEGDGDRALVMDGRYKYIRHEVSSVGVSSRFLPTWALEREEVFDLWTDPDERRNLIHSQRTLLARLRLVMEDEAPSPVEARVAFWGVDGRLQGSLSSSGGRWNARRTMGDATVRGAYGELGFESNGSAGGISVEPWPPSSSYMLSFRLDGRAVRKNAFRVSKLGLPLLENSGPEWHDRAKFTWMEGLSEPLPGETGPLIFVGRTRTGASWPNVFGAPSTPVDAHAAASSVPPATQPATPPAAPPAVLASSTPIPAPAIRASTTSASTAAPSISTSSALVLPSTVSIRSTAAEVVVSTAAEEGR